MRKTILKAAIVLLTVLLMLPCTALLPAGAAEIRLYDEGKRLSAEEIAECESRLKQAADYTGMNIVVILGTQARADLTIETLTEATYKEIYGVRSNGLCYYMDLKGYSPCDHISTFGTGNFYYTNGSPDRISAMFETLDTYMYPVGMESVYDAVMRFAELTEQYYDKGVPEYYCVYDDEERMYYHMENGELVATVGKPFRNPAIIFMFGAIGLVGGLMISLFTYFGVRSAYKFKFELSPTTYVNQKNVDYREQYDNFTHTSTSRVRIESSGSRGGGGGGSHSGMGHMSGGVGGGSHHR